MSALDNANLAVPTAGDSNESPSVETKFKVERDLAESVASELLGGGHTGVHLIRVVGTTRDNCNLIVTATLKNPEESSALHERIILLIQTVRARLEHEATLLGIFTKKRKAA